MGFCPVYAVCGVVTIAVMVSVLFAGTYWHYRENISVRSLQWEETICDNQIFGWEPGHSMGQTFVYLDSRGVVKKRFRVNDDIELRPGQVPRLSVNLT